MSTVSQAEQYADRRTVSIECTKEGVKFSCTGDIGNGSVTLRQHTDVENAEKNVEISLTEPVALTFSLKYLVNFCKASGLSGQVKLCLSNEVPLLVEYGLANNSYLRFYLAPKVCISISTRFRKFSTNMIHRSVTRSNVLTLQHNEQDFLVKALTEFTGEAGCIYGFQARRPDVWSERSTKRNLVNEATQVFRIGVS